MDESKIVLDTSLRLQKLFEQKTPFNILLTHNTDVRPGKNATDSLKKRVKFARENNGDIFLLASMVMETKKEEEDVLMAQKLSITN